MIKLEHRGLYFVGEYIKTNELPQKKAAYTFVLRMTVTVNGKKHTVKQTITKKGLTFNKAIESIVDDRATYKQNIVDRIRGTKAIDTATQKTVDEIYDDFYEHKVKEGDWSDSYIKTLKSSYKTHIKPVIGSMMALDVKHRDIVKVIHTIRDNGRSASVERAVIGIVSPMFKWWILTNDIDKNNPATGHSTRKEESREVNLDWEQIEKLYKVMYSWKDERHRQLWIWLSTGRRLNEVLSLKHADIDGDYFTIRAENNKVKKPMMYRLPIGVTLPLYKGFVFTSSRNREKQLTQATVNSQWLAVKAVADVDIHKHDLRHVIATVLTDSLVPDEVIRMVLGHIASGMLKKYKNDTPDTADLKAEAVSFFLDKVFGRIDRKLKWDLRKR